MKTQIGETKIFTIDDFRKWGSEGGHIRSKRYTKKDFIKWGRMGKNSRKKVKGT